MSSGGQGDYHPLAVEVARRRREDIIAIVQEAIRRLVAGEGNRLVPKSLPPGVLIDRGDWLAGARYRPGDLVIAGGSAYVAVAPSGGAAASVEPPDTAYWRPIGSAGGGIPPPFAYLTDGDGNYLVDGSDGSYLFEYL